MSAALDEAEQPPVIRHLRKVVNGWGVSLCGVLVGVLVETGVTCPGCLGQTRTLLTSERAG